MCCQGGGTITRQVLSGSQRYGRAFFFLSTHALPGVFTLNLTPNHHTNLLPQAEA